MLHLIANWKAQMKLSDAERWFADFTADLRDDEKVLEALENKKLCIVVCPPSPFLLALKPYCENIHNLQLGAQDVSMYEEGRYTGEVTVQALQGIVEYVIIGHSERRQHCHETEIMIETKLKLCEQYQLKPIHCVRSVDDKLYPQSSIISFEPPGAIGTGNNAAVADIVKLKNDLHIPEVTPFLYGGSVDEKNCSEYLATGQINGFLVGTRSLNPDHFFTLAKVMIGQ